MNLDNDKLVNEIYPYIVSSFDEILTSSNGDLQKIKNTIKLLSYNYLFDSNQIYYIEGFADILDTIKTTFWSTTLNLWSGNISMSNWLGGVGIKTLLTGKFGLSSFSTSAASEILKNVSGTTASTASNTTAAIASNTLLLRGFTAAIFPSVLLGLVIYRLIKYKDVLVIKNFETAIGSAIKRLNLTNAKEFKTELEMLNTRYNSILKDNCSKITDPKLRLVCASNYYIAHITDYLMIPIITSYTNYLIKSNIAVKHIVTFQDLCQFSFTKSIMYKQMSILYDSYIKLLDTYVFDDSQKRIYISKLNSQTKKLTQKVNS